MTNLFYVSVFEDWCKREIIDDKSQLHEYPSVIKYIIGHRGNNKPVLKVYLRNDDEKAKEFFKTCCFDDTHIEFVHVRKTEKKSKEVENMKKYETDAPAIDAPTMNQLNEIIEDQGEKIFARHSNVVGLEISNVRCAGDRKKRRTMHCCVQLRQNVNTFWRKATSRVHWRMALRC